MFNKITIVLILCSTLTVAQNNDNTDDFTIWKVVDVDVENKYLALESKKDEQLKEFKPICTSAKVWVFEYAMMGFDDSFYDASSQPSNLANIAKSSEYIMKIDVEEDDLQKTNSSSINKICTDHQAQMYFDPNGGNRHGIISYVGDKSISPPF